MAIDTTVFNDSTIIVEMIEEEYAQAFLAQNYMPGEEPYTMNGVDLLESGRVVYIVERDTTRFKSDMADFMELKFLDPDQWDNGDIQLKIVAATCPGDNGYYRLLYHRANNQTCPN